MTEHQGARQIATLSINHRRKGLETTAIVLSQQQTSTVALPMNYTWLFSEEYSAQQTVIKSAFSRYYYVSWIEFGERLVGSIRILINFLISSN